MIGLYEQRRHAVKAGTMSLQRATRNDALHRIKWTGDLRRRLKRDIRIVFDPRNRRIVHHRPFVKQWLYYEPSYIDVSIAYQRFSPQSPNTYQPPSHRQVTWGSVLSSRTRLSTSWDREPPARSRLSSQTPPPTSNSSRRDRHSPVQVRDGYRGRSRTPRPRPDHRQTGQARPRREGRQHYRLVPPSVPTALQRPVHHQRRHLGVRSTGCSTPPTGAPDTPTTCEKDCHVSPRSRLRGVPRRRTAPHRPAPRLRNQ